MNKLSKKGFYASAPKGMGNEKEEFIEKKKEKKKKTQTIHQRTPLKKSQNQRGGGEA